jgi:hypothetical protein
MWPSNGGLCLSLTQREATLRFKKNEKKRKEKKRKEEEKGRD